MQRHDRDNRRHGSLPRFRLTTRGDALAAMRALGVTDAFADEADFGRLARDPHLLRLGRLSQRAFLPVDEAGTKAAAATAGMASVGYGGPPKRVSVKFDRAFLAFLVDRDTGRILFIAHVVDPTASP